MNNFEPTLFISKGDEKQLSALLKKRALEYIGITKDILYTDKGKPYIDGNSAGISVTHDECVTAVLITPFEPIGIDIEKIKETYSARVCDNFFSEQEKNSVVTSKDFYKIWCKKESYVKMTGEGIAGISECNTLFTNVYYTDLSEKISEIFSEDFIFFICSKTPVKPNIIII